MTLLNVYIILLHKKPFVNTLIKNIKLTLKNLILDAANFFPPKNIIKRLTNAKDRVIIMWLLYVISLLPMRMHALNGGRIFDQEEVKHK